MKKDPAKAAAKAAGQMFYNTGRPCAKGHMSDRLVSTSACRQCTNEAHADWLTRPGNKEKKDRQTRESKQRNNWGYNAKARIRMRNYYREKKGIPEAPYPPPENCELCGEPMVLGKGVHLDHDHVTGKFRGWLHNKCNRGLGCFGDNVAGLKKALAYLERTST